MLARYWKVALVVAVLVPSLVIRAGGIGLGPLETILVYGSAVVASSFLLAWAAEIAQVDISASFATALLALVAVLPEYAVDLYFAFTSGSRPEYAAFAAANMTGSNRLLIGIGWPLVAFVFAIGLRRLGKPQRSVVLKPRRRVELAFLGVASVYAFVIPLKRSLSIVDSVVLLLLFGVYLWRSSTQEHEEPELHGLPADIARESTAIRRTFVCVFFALAAVVITLSARPFADGLIASGRHLGLDEFLLVQWLAPLSSEAPELLVAGILAFRGDDETALATLLSSKVNQWTMLVGSLPIAHAIGGGGIALPLSGRQNEEFVLTAAQAIFSVVLLLSLKLRFRDALILLATFLLQFAFPQTATRLIFAGGYVGIAVILLIVRRAEIVPTLRSVLPRKG